MNCAIARGITVAYGGGEAGWFEGPREEDIEGRRGEVVGGRNIACAQSAHSKEARMRHPESDISLGNPEQGGRRARMRRSGGDGRIAPERPSSEADWVEQARSWRREKRGGGGRTVSERPSSAAPHASGHSASHISGMKRETTGNSRKTDVHSITFRMT